MSKTMRSIIMTRRAFTLVEVLSVIVILGILLAIAVPSIYNLVEDSKNNSYKVMVDIIESSAKLYVSRNKEEISNIIDDEGVYEISLDELISRGILEYPLIDPRTNEEIPTTKKVLVMKDENDVLFYCFEDNNCS
jgi:type IV pilus assembly protein PilA